MTRREALTELSMFLAGSPLLCAQNDPPYQGGRTPALDELVNVFDFEPICRQRIPRVAYDYIAGGVDNEWSLRHNREAFDRITFRPRMMVDVSKLDVSTTLFGSRLEMPILIAPTAGHQQAHPDGELATMRAAAAKKSLMVVSTGASYPIDKIGQAAGDWPFWFQLYPGPDMDGTEERVLRALESGAQAIVLTVDGMYNSHRERLLHNRINDGGPPPREGQTESQTTTRRRAQTRTAARPYGLIQTMMATLTWKFLDDLNKWAAGRPVLVKGILTPEDGELCVKHGAAGVVVSNHGARYLEYAPATIEVLPEIVDAVKDRIPVLVDSGFRRGTDILKALAIGAKAVLVGRPPLWGLGAFGQRGVERVLELLQQELALAMGLSGQPSLSTVTPKLVRIEHR